jgi:hypothetical protein
MSQAVEPEKKHTSERDAWIDVLANRNPAPKLVKQRVWTVPLFPSDYDWNEPERVWTAFFAFAKNKTEESWERLLVHIDDKRYAITMCDNSPSARNYSVGELCRLLVSDELYFPSAMRSDPESRDRHDIYLDIGIDELPKWRKNRPNKVVIRTPN